MTRLLRRRLARLGDDDGTNLLEAALLTPLLLFVTFAIAEFGTLFYIYLTLENGVSQATRYAVTGQMFAGMDREGSIRQAMRDAAPTLTLEDGAFSFSHLPPSGASWLPGAGGPSEIGKVTVNYTWTFFTPLVRPLFTDGQITLVVESAMMNERFE